MESNRESKKNPAPTGQTAPAGAGKAPAGAVGETTEWARSRIEWTCLNALEMKRRELVLVLRDLEDAADRLRGRK